MARRFASEGATVIITGRTEQRGAAIQQQIEDEGGKALFVKMDVSDEEQVIAGIAKTVETFGKLTGLVNNAAWVQDRNDAPLTELDTDHWKRLIESDLHGFFHTSKHGLKAIAAAGGGAVVNMSSTAGIRGHMASHSYSACKGAIQSLTQSMGAYYSRYKIRVNCLVVGPFDTGEPRLRAIFEDPVKSAKVRHQYLGRVGQPHEVAAAAAFLMSRDASYINGVLLPVDNGGTMRGHTGNGVINMSGIAPPENDWVALAP
jgi:3-oxoacyl-[acyl-carrier protein] reductase